MKIDFLILGAGLAGTILAYELEKRNLSFKIINNSKNRISSLIAAGLYNPIVFKRLALSWKAELIVPYLDDFYTKLEQRLNSKFHHKIDILKVFTDENEIELWQKKAILSTHKDFIDNKIYSNIAEDYFHQFKGFGRVKQSGYLDMPNFFKSSDEYLSDHIIEEDFDFSKLEINSDISYKDIEAKYIVFCEGWRAVNNPFFSQIPFKLTKGEVLTIEADVPNFDFVMNKNAFILPMGNGLLKVGATYEWNELNEETTEAAREHLIEKIKNIAKFDFVIKEHQAGIRPTVIDRRPLIGKSPQNDNVLIFNGMGTKGVILAPYFASHFIEHILNNSLLDPEVNINRFRK